MKINSLISKAMLNLYKNTYRLIISYSDELFKFKNKRAFSKPLRKTGCNT